MDLRDLESHLEGLTDSQIKEILNNAKKQAYEQRCENTRREKFQMSGEWKSDVRDAQIKIQIDSNLIDAWLSISRNDDEEEYHCLKLNKPELIALRKLIDRLPLGQSNDEEPKDKKIESFSDLIEKMRRESFPRPILDSYHPMWTYFISETK